MKLFCVFVSYSFILTLHCLLHIKAYRINQKVKLRIIKILSIFNFLKRRFYTFFSIVTKMSNLCDENDKIYKKKKFPDNKNGPFGE